MKRTSAITQLTLLDEREARKPSGKPLLVTDDMIGRYRSTIDLIARKWQDERVRDFVTTLSTHLKIAVMMDWERTVTDIVAVLWKSEPLEERTETSYEGTLLLVCSRRYCHPEGLSSAIKTAIARFPEDARFQRLARQMAEQKGNLP